MAKSPETRTHYTDVITPVIEGKHRSATELLERQNVLVDSVIEIDNKLGRLKSTLDKEMYDALDIDLREINKVLVRTFIPAGDSQDEKVALQDLGELAVHSADRKNEASEEAEAVGGNVRLQGHDKHRTKAAEKIIQTISVKDLELLEQQLSELGLIVDVVTQCFSILKTPEEDKKYTNLQIANARAVMVVVRQYTVAKPRKERQFEPVHEAVAEFKRSLDLENLARDATDRMERVITTLVQEFEQARSRGQGIMELFQTVSKVGRLDMAELERIYGEAQVASAKVQAAYTDVVATTKQVEQKLQTGSAKPAQIEALITTIIRNGNLRELYCSSFDVAMNEFNVAIDALGKLLNLRPTAELAAKPEPKGLLEGKIGITESESEQAYQEFKELFGDKFLGREAVEQAFTLQNDQKLIEFSPYQKAEAARLLGKFTNEPDVKQFMEKVKRGDIKKGGWQLRLEVATFTDPKSHLETTLTMTALEQHLAPDMKARKQGKLLYEVSWYKPEKFYTTDSMQFQWVLSTDEAVPATLDKNHDAQTKELEKFAISNGLQFDRVKSRSQPLETLYRFFIMLRTTGRRILETMYDCSATTSSDGDLVFVGDCVAGGASVYRLHPECVGGYLGSSFSRRSGQSSVT